MLTKETFKLTALAIAVSLSLAACGGGGGGGSSNAAPATGASAPTAASTPATTTGVAPQTSVAAPTYAAGTFQATAFQLVNNYRLAMGVGELSQDPILDVSGQAQSLYLFSNLKAGTITALDHTEIQGNANYYGDTPLSRAQKAGAPATEWIAEEAAAGATTAAASDAADCVGQFLASVYHLVALTANQQTIGLGYTPGDSTYPIYACATEFGTSTGVNGAPPANSLSYVGGQIIPVGTVVHSPFTNESGVALAMRAESPNPAADVAAPGRPILVSVNAQNGTDTLTVSQFLLTDSTGATVAARILVPAASQAGSTATVVADPNNLLANGTAVLLPLAPLKANTTYTVSFNGARDGSAVSSTWNFSTSAQ
jgi:hypothetical protein